MRTTGSYLRPVVKCDAKTRFVSHLKIEADSETVTR